MRKVFHLPKNSKVRIVACSSILLLGACRDKGMRAVRDVMDFAASATFDLGKPTSKYSGYSVRVADAELSKYNSVFENFLIPSMPREDLYARLPLGLVYSIPVTKVISYSTVDTTADSAMISVVFERPSLKLYKQQVLSVVETNDSLMPSKETRDRFSVELKRVRQELQEIDTARFWLTRAGKIARFYTASAERDEHSNKLARDSVLVDLRRTIPLVSLTSVSVNDYSSLSSGGQSLGGSVEGTAIPGPSGWPHASEKVSVIHGVQCEATNGVQTSLEWGYLPDSKMTSNLPVRFLCLWSGDQAEKWKMTTPRSIKLRLLSVTGSDTVSSEWQSVAARPTSRD